MADIANRVVDRMIRDLTDRRGLRQQWEQIDDETQQEIAETWRQIVREETNTHDH